MADMKFHHSIRWRRPFQLVSGCARFLLGLRNAGISRPFTSMQVALVCAGLTLATSGCGFLSMVFNGEDQQTLRETGVCDSLASGYAAEVPLLVELRTDKAGST